MPTIRVAKKAGAAFASRRRRVAERGFSADNPPPLTPQEVRKSREFAKQMHRAIVAKGYTEADITRIIKEVRAELRGAQSPR